MSLRLVPPTSHPTHTSNTFLLSSVGAPSAPGLPDTLRASLTYNPNPSTPNVASAPISAHPLEARLAAWTATQDDLKMSGLRRTFGMAEPVRRGMELKIAREGEWRPAVLGGSSGLSGDLLAGRDLECSWEDVFRGDETRDTISFHTEMEGRLKMEW